jgi:hypothetical protein
MPARQLTILLSGMIAGVPRQGGATWAVLQYLLGLRRLGHAVYFVESVGKEALSPAGAPLERSANARYFEEVMAEFGFMDHAALILEGTKETVGLSYATLRRIAEKADLLVNLSGLLADEALTQAIPVRAYIDLDPAFTQLWHEVQGIDMGFNGHSHYVTVGENIGRPGCKVPTCGLAWLTTPQPVVLEHWPVAGSVEHDAFTTVANWRGYGSIEHGGVFYGQKAHSLRRFIELPSRSEAAFALALAIHPEETQDLAALRRHGWRLLEPEEFAASPASYRRFIQGSKAELAIAKLGYAESRCGWFSDRSICYLASGRPVVAQETGFSEVLPVGEGLLSFESTDEALAAIEAVNGDYERHRRAARALAEEHFASDRVLTKLLERLGVAP